MSSFVRFVLMSSIVVVTCQAVALADTFLAASFDLDNEGFVYGDDAFRSTFAPGYASGSHLPTGGEVGGGLRILLGDLDGSTVLGMSGGHTQTFTLTTLTDLQISFRYNLTQASDYESDEFSQVMVSLDSVPLPGLGVDYVDGVTGNGNGGTPISTGWLGYSIDLPAMAAGTYALTIGGYNNKKTASNELTTVLIDDVAVTGFPTIPCVIPADCDDSNSCTDDVCNAGICEHPSNTASCDDGVACTSDVCGGGVCVGTDACSGGATCSAISNQCEQPASNPLVAALVFQYFKDHIENLSTSNPPINGSRHWTQPGNAAALDYIQTSFESSGYIVERHAYTYQTQTRENIYATKVGSLIPEEMMIVSAHMDSISQDDPSGAVAPGANDDASGTALVLEAARVFGNPAIVTDRSVRFILWNNEETGSQGSAAYLVDRKPMQGIESPAGSGLYPEPTWIGMIQHDMMLWDHGVPPGPTQLASADIDIEYLDGSGKDAESLVLANWVAQANVNFAPAYPAEVSHRMCCTDSTIFQSEVASISIRENRRELEIGNGSNPHHHRGTDRFTTYSDPDFALGFNALQTTVGAVSEIVNAQIITTCGDGVLDAGEQCDDGNLLAGDCCSPLCTIEPAGTVCRSAAGVCDAPDMCDGIADACPADSKLVSECRSSVDVCDVAESCDGVADECPVDAVEPTLTLCREAAGDCDVEEFCDGAAKNCPADLKLNSECRPSVDVCDVAESCDGVENDCPTDAVLNGTPCEDGDACTTEDFCSLGACAAGSTPLACDDFDPCTADSCDAVEGCGHAPVVECPPVAEVPAMSVSARIALTALFATLASVSLAMRPTRKK